MSRFDSSLCNVMRNKEEIKFAVDNFGLLNEALVNIGALRRILDSVPFKFEESLSDSFVDNDQSNVRNLLAFVFLREDFLELVKFEFNDHLSHRVANTISVNEDVIRQRAIKLFVSL